LHRAAWCVSQACECCKMQSLLCTRWAGISCSSGCVLVCCRGGSGVVVWKFRQWSSCWAAEATSAIPAVCVLATTVWEVVQVLTALSCQPVRLAGKQPVAGILASDWFAPSLVCAGPFAESFHGLSWVVCAGSCCVVSALVGASVTTGLWLLGPACTARTGTLCSRSPAISAPLVVPRVGVWQAVCAACWCLVATPVD